MKKTNFFTICIPTYNRSESLSVTLDSLAKIKIPKNKKYEILIVDNNSTDDTSLIIGSYTNIFGNNIRIVNEYKQGLNYARNKGLNSAKGDIICFLDDDVVVNKEWLVNLSKTFDNYDVDVVGGKAYLIYPFKKPSWLKDNREFLLSKIDYGNKTLFDTDKDLFGLNLAVLKKTALELGGFNPNLDRCGKSLISGGDSEFVDRARNKGYKIIYEPTAVVGHIVSKNRLTKKWFLRRCFGGGRTAIKRSRILRKDLSIFSASYNLIFSFLSYMKYLLFFNNEETSVFERKMVLYSRFGSFIEKLNFK